MVIKENGGNDFDVVFCLVSTIPKIVDLFTCGTHTLLSPVMMHWSLATGESMSLATDFLCFFEKKTVLL